MQYWIVTLESWQDRSGDFQIGSLRSEEPPGVVFIPEPTECSMREVPEAEKGKQTRIASQLLTIDRILASIERYFVREVK